MACDLCFFFFFLPLWINRNHGEKMSPQLSLDQLHVSGSLEAEQSWRAPLTQALTLSEIQISRDFLFFCTHLLPAQTEQLRRTEYQQISKKINMFTFLLSKDILDAHYKMDCNEWICMPDNSRKCSLFITFLRIMYCIFQGCESKVFLKKMLFKEKIMLWWLS